MWFLDITYLEADCFPCPGRFISGFLAFAHFCLNLKKIIFCLYSALNWKKETPWIPTILLRNIKYIWSCFHFCLTFKKFTLNYSYSALIGKKDPSETVPLMNIKYIWSCFHKVACKKIYSLIFKFICQQLQDFCMFGTKS